MKKKVVSQRLGALIANLHTFKKDGWTNIYEKLKPGTIRDINK
jgi:hypothetical protein